MIAKIAIKGFKSLKSVTLSLGKLNVFIGSNASGKTNFLEALRVAQGIGYGYTIGEIFDGKPKGANSDIWEGIRGGSSKIGFVYRDEQSGMLKFQQPRLSLEVLAPRLKETFRYNIRISSERGWVTSESLHVGDTAIYESDETTTPKPPVLTVLYHSGPHKTQRLLCERSKPALLQLTRNDAFSKHHVELVATCARLMSNVQRLEPSPAVLREYSQPAEVRRMGNHGENFAALINAIRANPQTASAYLSWLQQITPAEVDKISILRGALQEPLFALTTRGQIFPAPVLSDGTLRFAAIAAAFFQPDLPDTLMIEEIENGIHPTRLRLLVELLKSQSDSGPQTMVTTHSPTVLAWLDKSDFGTTFFCRKDEETGASTITPLSEIPHFLDVVQKQPITDLFAEGWLEAAL